MVNIDLEDSEAEFFIALRQSNFFELKDTDIIIHKNKDGVITDIKKLCIKPKEKFIFIYKRTKLSTGECA